MEQVILPPAWEFAIKRNAEISKLCIESNDYQYFSGLISLQKFDPYKVTMGHLTPSELLYGFTGPFTKKRPVSANLVAISNSALNTIKSCWDWMVDVMITESDEEDPDENKPMTEEEWTAMLSHISKQSTYLLLNMVDKWTNEMLGRMKELPEMDRTRTADICVLAWALVMQEVKLFRTVWDNSIDNLIKNMWEYDYHLYPGNFVENRLRDVSKQVHTLFTDQLWLR